MKARLPARLLTLRRSVAPTTSHYPPVRTRLPRSGERVESCLRQPATYRHVYKQPYFTVSLTDTPSMSSSYAFPGEKIQSVLEDETRTPLVLVECGSFSPITFLHLRMFEMCRDWVRENTNYEIIAGFLSPVADAYKKEGLAAAKHRVQMCKLATQESAWITVDPWEADKEEYTRTALVLDHFHHEINNVRGGIQLPSGGRRHAQISLLSGADLVQTFSSPGVWAPEDLDHILVRYGAFIIERSGTDLGAALSHLQQWRQYIHSIPQLIQNDVSSTKIRTFLRKDMSIRYLIPESALRYIDQHGLFKEHGQSPPREQEKMGPAPTNGKIVNGV